MEKSAMRNLHDTKCNPCICVALTIATAMVVSYTSLADDDDDDGSGPQTIELTGIIRDFTADGHPDFLINPSATPGAKSAKNIGLTLDADNKPVYVGNGLTVGHEWKDSENRVIGWCQPPLADDDPGEFSSPDSGGIEGAETFAQWFRDIPGVNMSGLWTLTLTKKNSGDPMWSYSTNNFNPIDEQLLGNGTDEHNFYFTYEIVADLVYHADANQFLWYKGSDDCWIFIDDKLVIDHGGIAANRNQCVYLDRLGLTDGEQCQMRFFMAERFQPQTQFHIKTNIELLSVTPTNVSSAFD
jgi:fibro-slime domain-containing protein